MLVLTRSPGRSFYIKTAHGEMIRVTLVQIKQDHNSVRIGIEAPQDVAIMREELVGYGDQDRITPEDVKGFQPLLEGKHYGKSTDVETS